MRILLILIFTFVTTSLFAQNLDCQDYKNGKFKIIDEMGGKSIIERDGAKQIDYHIPSKLKLKLDITWIDNCTFTAQIDEVLENPNNIRLSEEATFTVEIIKIKEDSYIQRTTSTSTEIATETEAFKIE